MVYQYLLAILTISGVYAQHDHHNHQHHWVDVKVYYESLCPDSIKFFTRQLYPSLQGNLSNYVNLTLVPFGKSTYKVDGTEIKFECHHGPAECRGNKIQACALRLINQGAKTEDLGFNKVATAFINCLMDKVDRKGNDTQFPIKECAELNSVQRLAEIEGCSNHVDASNYLSELGKLTMQLNPPLKSVPTIVFNGVYKQEDNDLAQTNFVKALCQYIQGEKPGECTRNGASMLHLNFAIILVVVARFFY